MTAGLIMSDRHLYAPSCCYYGVRGRRLLQEVQNDC